MVQDSEACDLQDKEVYADYTKSTRSLVSIFSALFGNCAHPQKPCGRAKGGQSSAI